MLFKQIILLFCLYSKCFADENYSFQEFDNSPGIYFQNTGSCEIVREMWTINVYINWTLIKEKKNEIISFSKNLQKIKSNYIYIETIKNLERKIKKQEKTLNIAKSINRQKRSIGGNHGGGFFNVVGRISNELFGTLDDKYAADIDRDIQNLRQNNKKTNLRLSNYSVLFEQTLDVFKKQEKDLENFKKNERENEKLSILKNLVEDYHNELHTLINAIFKPELYIMDVLDLNEFSNIVNEVKQNSGNFAVPSLNPKELYDISSVSTFSNENSIVFVIRFPLVDKTKYKMLKIHDVPTKDYMYIKSDIHYIVVQENNFFFYTFKDSEMTFSTCRFIGNLHLCKTTSPLYNINQNDICEFSLFRNIQSKSCKKKRVNLKTQFYIKPLTANSWIFVCFNTTELQFNIKCGDLKTTIKIEKTGILTLKSGCSLEGNDIILYTIVDKLHFSIINSSLFIEDSILPKFNLSDESILNEINDLQKNLKDQIRIDRLNIDSQQSNDYFSPLTNYTLLTASIIVLFLVSLIIVWKISIIRHKKRYAIVDMLYEKQALKNVS